MEGRSSLHNAKDGSASVDSSRQRREDYESPRLLIIGPLDKITLGSGGTMNDGINKLKSK